MEISARYFKSICFRLGTGHVDTRNRHYCNSSSVSCTTRENQTKARFDCQFPQDLITEKPEVVPAVDYAATAQPSTQGGYVASRASSH